MLIIKCYSDNVKIDGLLLDQKNNGLKKEKEVQNYFGD